MFTTYLRRELGNRRRQTVIVATGLALAIALVIVVTAVSAGVRAAQSSVLESVYGVGTDVTVTETAEAGGGPQRFEFGAPDEGDGTAELSESRLITEPGAASFDAGVLDTVAAVDGVAAAAGTLSLTNTAFSGEIPDFSELQPGELPAPGGADGEGGSAFEIESSTVEGVDAEGAAVGPLTALEVTAGRGLEPSDAGASVAVLDESYASAEGLAVGDIVNLGGEDVEVVGIAASTTADATSAADVYIPLDTAQRLAGLDGQLTSVYVRAESADGIADVESAIESAVPDATVSTAADLAADVSGSLSTASDLVTDLGAWLAVIVLAAAFLLAVLFTSSSVARRTREFGTLKAIGWGNGRIVRQVAGESLVQGLVGGVAGIALGLIAILVLNGVAPTLSASSGGSAAPTGDALVGPGGAGAPGGFAGLTASTTEVVLQAPVTLSVILIAVGLAMLGGLLAGAVGGWRAARLSPAESLRSVA